MNPDKIIRTAMTTFLAMAAASPLHAATAETPSQALEKCYGVTKAGMNDCATTTSSCASSATKDRQEDAFILVPKGLCDRLAGGHLKSEKDKKTDSNH